MNNIQCANIIKKYCKQQGVTITTLLAECNIRKSLIYDMEKRDKTPSAEVFELIANYLNCSVDYLLGRTDCPDLITMDQLNRPTVIRMPGGEKAYKIKIAARDGGGIIETTITDSDLKKINELRDVDDL